MSDTPINGSNGEQQLSLNGQQLAALLIIEGLAQHMQTCANQLGGFMKYPAAGDVVARSLQKLMRDYADLKNNWGRVVQLATPAAQQVIEGKKIQ